MATHPVGTVTGSVSALSPTLPVATIPRSHWDHPISHLHSHYPWLGYSNTSTSQNPGSSPP